MQVLFNSLRDETKRLKLICSFFCLRWFKNYKAVLREKLDNISLCAGLLCIWVILQRSSQIPTSCSLCPKVKIRKMHKLAVTETLLMQVLTIKLWDLELLPPKLLLAPTTCTLLGGAHLCPTKKALLLLTPFRLPDLFSVFLYLSFLLWQKRNCSCCLNLF